MGLRNNYRNGMPLSEAIIKDIFHVVSGVKNFVSNGFTTKSIYVFPDYPSKKTSLFKLASKLNYNLSNKKRGAPDMYIYWEDSTFASEQYKNYNNTKSTRPLNIDCSDISKEFVDEIHHNVFGYGCIVDPLTTKGTAVAKSDINAKHDGEIITLPLTEIVEEKVYQILIDNSISEEEVLDYRIPVVGECLDFVFMKYKDSKTRFDNTTLRVKKMNVEDVFSKEEIAQVNAFCKEIRLDFGELDILRDNQSKLIYIIDVNKTPYSPPAGLNPKDSAEVVEIITTAFSKEFLHISSVVQQ